LGHPCLCQFLVERWKRLSSAIADTVHAVENALFDFVLIDGVEDVRRPDQYGRRANHCYRQEHVQLQTIDHHRDVAPIFKHLRIHRLVLYAQCTIVQRRLHLYSIIYYTPCPKKTKQICFCQNCVKFPPILIIFGRRMANDPNICEVHSFSILPNLRHHLTVLNAKFQIAT